MNEISEEGEFQQVSFVNGVWTLRGGKHVEEKTGFCFVVVGADEGDGFVFFAAASRTRKKEKKTIFSYSTSCR